MKNRTSIDRREQQGLVAGVGRAAAADHRHRSEYSHGGADLQQFGLRHRADRLQRLLDFASRAMPSATPSREAARIPARGPSPSMRTTTSPASPTRAASPATLSYDAGDRLTGVSITGYSGEAETFSYDDTTSGNKGVGRLTSVSDESGSTAAASTTILATSPPKPASSAARPIRSATAMISPTASPRSSIPRGGMLITHMTAQAT